jgi:ribosomal protein L40E
MPSRPVVLAIVLAGAILSSPACFSARPAKPPAPAKTAAPAKTVPTTKPCANCGATIPIGAKYCLECGAKQ